MDNILLATEIELYINTMNPQSMENIGSKQWMEWHQRIQKLNQEAVIEATGLKEEAVKETLIQFGKIPVLVHEVILINLWKNKILPILLRMEPNPSTTFIAYSILYHEAVCVALLELVMYHGNASEALGDAAADLLDYSYGTVSQLLVLDGPNNDEDDKTRKELVKHSDDLSFEIGLRSLTILRYLADYIDRLPLAITSSMFTMNDVPVLLIQVLLMRPWINNSKQYTGGEWIDWDGEALNTTEAQVWLALRQLLLDPACTTHYDITDSRKSQLLKLQPLLTPILLDQLSPLIELHEWICRLAVTSQPTATNKPLLFEIVLEIRTNIVNQCKGKWKKIAQQQLPIIFCNNHQQLVETAQSLSEAYNTELLEKFEKVKQVKAKTCANCGKTAIQRCSRCKSQWYCSRNCQIVNWSEHKDQCLEKSV